MSQFNDIKFEPLPVLLFSDTAESYAQSIASNSGDRVNKPTQIRKFYDELVMWHDRTWTVDTAARDENLSTARDKKFRENEPFIRMLTAKVAYAESRGHVDRHFLAFFKHCITTVNSAETLRRCKLFIEAFMGFYKSAAAHKK